MLGEMLVEAGVISKEQLAEVLKDQQNGCKKKIGEILVEKGYVSQANIFKALNLAGINNY